MGFLYAALAPAFALALALAKKEMEAMAAKAEADRLQKEQAAKAEADARALHAQKEALTAAQAGQEAENLRLRQQLEEVRAQTEKARLAALKHEEFLEMERARRAEIDSRAAALRLEAEAYFRAEKEKKAQEDAKVEAARAAREAERAAAEEHTRLQREHDARLQSESEHLQRELAAAQEARGLHEARLAKQKAESLQLQAQLDGQGEAYEKRGESWRAQKELEAQAAAEKHAAALRAQKEADSKSELEIGQKLLEKDRMRALAARQDRWAPHLDPVRTAQLYDGQRAETESNCSFSTSFIEGETEITRLMSALNIGRVEAVNLLQLREQQQRDADMQGSEKRALEHGREPDDAKRPRCGDMCSYIAKDVRTEHANPAPEASAPVKTEVKTEVCFLCVSYNRGLWRAAPLATRRGGP